MDRKITYRLWQHWQPCTACISYQICMDDGFFNWMEESHLALPGSSCQHFQDSYEAPQEVQDYA